MFRRKSFEQAKQNIFNRQSLIQKCHLINLKSNLSIGVIGAGQMGVGIAHVAALSKHDVILLDNSRQKTDKALEFIGK